MAFLVASEKRRRLRRWILPLAVLLVGAAFALPPLVNINRFHHRIAEIIARSIGRPVRIDSVKIHVLPRPGFEIEGFEVEEDPAFGAEPILRCADVTAYVRLLSLWRGRLEIARIGFDEPSLNLVRNSRGQWNFDSLLSQAARAPHAPTTQLHAGDVPRFPYIDASSARINFKFGDEKMPFSFLNADLSVWLANPEEWKVQFAAQPVRTDLTLDLANTGLVRIDGSMRRAPSLNEMPINLHAEWANAPLGQLSRILTGSDADWRGELDATADIVGTAEHASLKVAAKGSGIHRIEFEPLEPLNVDVSCQGDFTRSGYSFDAVTCLVPTGEGHLLLTGSLHNLSANPDPALSLEINHTPVASAFDGLRLIRYGFAPAVQATGVIDGNFTYGQSGRSTDPQLQGEATIERLTIAAPALEKPLALPTLHFSMNAPPPTRPRRHPRQSPVVEEEPTLLLAPFALGQANALTASSLNVSGAFNRAGFSLHIGGQSRIDQVVALGNEFGVFRNRSVSFSPKGAADLDMTVRGPWLMPITDPDRPVPPVSLEGSLRVRNAQVTGDFLAQPVQVGAAVAVFGDNHGTDGNRIDGNRIDGNRIEWSASSLTYGPIHANGTLSYPAFCQTAAQCVRRFTLRAASLDAATAQNALLGSARHGELLQQLIARIGREEHPWPAMTGTVQVGALALGDLTLRDLTANLSLEDSAVRIDSLSARALDGTVDVSGKIEVAGGTPRYEIVARLNRAAATMAAALFQEKWGPGSINLTTKVRMSGFEWQQLASTAVGTFDWEWVKGGLPIDEPDPTAASPQAPNGNGLGVEAALAHFDSWTAEGTIAESTLVLQNSKIISGGHITPITGTIGFDRQLKLAASDSALLLTGTLESPKMNAPPGENAVPAQP